MIKNKNEKKNNFILINKDFNASIILLSKL